MLLYQYRSERLSPYCRGCCTFDSDIASKPPVRHRGHLMAKGMIDVLIVKHQYNKGLSHIWLNPFALFYDVFVPSFLIEKLLTLQADFVPVFDLAC